MQLHGYWRDGAIVQRDVPFSVTGKTQTAQTITVRLVREEDGEELERVVCTARAGRFSAVLKGRPGSYVSYALLCEGEGEAASCRGLLFGEVWLASGQSNMEFVLRSCADRGRADELYSPYIRYLNCGKPADYTDGGEVARAVHPLDELAADGWRTADSLENAGGMSGVAFFMAAACLERLGVPVGVICTAVGGTTIEAWLPRDTVEADPLLIEHLRRTGRYVAVPQCNTRGGGNYTQMSGLYNERIAPLRGVSLRGLVWLQGESSAGSEEEAGYYTRALTALVTAWRALLGPRLPCLVVDIAAENYQFEPLAVPHLNEGIAAAVDAMDTVWEVPVYDLPLTWRIDGTADGHPIHPSEKYPVGTRAAAVACAAVYALPDGALAPRMTAVSFEGERALVRFRDVGGGLCCPDGALRGFTLCGENGVHLEAAARIVSPDTVEVTHPAVRRAAGVTYAFALYNQRANLYGSGGIPAVPFRRETAPPVYTEPREWLNADRADAFESCFECALGGAGYKPLWKPGALCGTAEAAVTVEDGVRLDYRTGWETGFLAGASPEIALAGRYHGLDLVDYLDVELDNPDEREKAFVGILIRTLRGRSYYLPVAQGEERRLFAPLAAGARGAVYRVDLRAFFGCYLAPEGKAPADVSDMTAMELVFMDKCPEPGRILIRRLTPGFWT